MGAWVPFRKATRSTRLSGASIVSIANSHKRAPRRCMPRLSSESGAHSFSAFKCPAQMQRQIELKGNVTLSLPPFLQFRINQPMRHLGRRPLLFSITIRVVIGRFHRIKRRNIARSDNLSGLLLKYDLNEMRFPFQN